MLPKHLVLVRHGQSEANIFQQMTDGTAIKIPSEFTSRHDSQMRLSPLGSNQARIAGRWLKEHNLAEFDKYFVSPHIRTRETAAHLRLGGHWRLDDRWRERDWGELASLSKEEQRQEYANSINLKKQNEWYWKPLGGESMATGVRARFTAIMDLLYRQTHTDRVIGVTHGELIRVAQFVIEQMDPTQFVNMDADPAYKVQNTMIVHYTRVNPETGEEEDSYHWRRAICPWNESFSWDGGEWTEFRLRYLTDDELLESALEIPRLLV